MSAPEILDIDTLCRTEAYTVERRQVKIDVNETITREVIDDATAFIVLIPTTEDGDPYFCQLLHPANTVYYWGFPHLQLPRAMKDSFGAAVTELVRESFGMSARAENVTPLITLFEDAVSIIDRQVHYYRVTLADVPQTNIGSWSADAASAILQFTTGLRTDSFTLAGLLWLDAQGDRTSNFQARALPPGSQLPTPPNSRDRDLFVGRWFSIVSRNFRTPTDNKGHDQEVIRRTDTVLVVPVQGRRVITLREYFAGVNGLPPGLVGGHVQQGLSASAVAAVAHREMREECGMSGKLTRLASTYGSPDLTRTVHHFLATRLFHDPLDTGTEDHDVRARWDELGDLIPGKLLDSFVVSEVVTILLSARELAQHPQLVNERTGP
jgi:ADP-ribose pyrophosphatase YjhB (NUDIX family)